MENFDDCKCIVTPSPDESNNNDVDSAGKGKRKVGDLDQVSDHLKVWLAAELEAYPCCEDYITSAASNSSSSDNGINEALRKKLCEWCYSVVDHYEYDREVVSIALDFLDRSMAKRSCSSTTPTTKNEFQLLAITSLYTAIKVHGQNDRSKGQLKMNDFVQLSRGLFSASSIEASERRMLSDLQWRVNPPTSLRFIAYYLKLLPLWDSDGESRSHAQVKSEIFEVARYLAELSVCVSRLAFTFTPSTTAYVSIICALDVLQENMVFPYDVRQSFLKSLAEITGLLPQAPEVRSARAAFQKLCPAMFEGELPAEFQSGKASPVSTVLNGDKQDFHKNKRIRTHKDDPSKEGC